MIHSLPTIILCFYENDLWDSGKRCRSLTRRNDGPLNDIKDFVFETEFELDKVGIPDSAHYHYRATISNYLGLPLILGGSGNWHGVPGNNKLEMLNTMKTPPTWIAYEETDYPYSNP